MRWLDNPQLDAARRREERLGSKGAELERKYWIALALFAGLAVLAWFTMDAGKVMVLGRPVEMRLVPLVVIGGFALRTVLAHKADRIRRGSEKGGSSTPEDVEEG